MKILAATLVLLALLSGTVLAQKSAPAKGNKTGNATLATLSGEEKQLWDAWKNKTPEPLKNLIADDGVNVSYGGPSGKDAFLKEIATGACDVKSFDLKDFKTTTFSPTTVLLTYKAEQQGTCGGQALPPAVYGSSVYMKRGGKWVVVFHQETPAM